MKSVKELNVKGKKVILRCDLNVSIKDNVIVSDNRIIESLDTIKYLLSQKSKIIILSHLGKVKNNKDKKNSLYIVYKKLVELLPNNKIYFSASPVGYELEKFVNNLQEEEIVLVENTRFMDLENNKESKCDEELSKYWASLGDVFIDDAFGLSHRQHASNYGIKKYLESGIGFLIEKELNMLEPLMNPKKPFTVIIGGAKVDDKSLLISKMLERCEYLLLGGGIANTFLKVNNEVGLSLVSEEYIDNAKELLVKYNEKIILPLDVIVLNNGSHTTKSICDVNSEDVIYDIGPKTIDEYNKYIMKSETIFINGTVGLYEDNRFSNGTNNILKMSTLTKAKVILGGGDAVASSDYFNIKDFYHLSTGGGASLNYIANQKLKVMETNNVNSIKS